MEDSSHKQLDIRWTCATWANGASLASGVALSARPPACVAVAKACKCATQPNGHIAHKWCCRGCEYSCMRRGHRSLQLSGTTNENTDSSAQKPGRLAHRSQVALSWAQVFLCAATRSMHRGRQSLRVGGTTTKNSESSAQKPGRLEHRSQVVLSRAQYAALTRYRNQAHRHKFTE
eukprot:5877310-Alexandrium_andersonii.AAC.1